MISCLLEQKYKLITDKKKILRTNLCVRAVLNGLGRHRRYHCKKVIKPFVTFSITKNNKYFVAKSFFLLQQQTFKQTKSENKNLVVNKI